MKQILFPALVLGLFVFPVNAGSQGQDHHHTRSLTEPSSYSSERFNRQMSEEPTAAGSTAEKANEDILYQEDSNVAPSRNSAYGNNKR